MRLNFSKIKNTLNNFWLFREASGSSSQITNSNLKNFIIKHAGYSGDSDDYTQPENDLTEVKSAISTDSYIKVALDKTFQLILKSGYKLTSENEAAVEYLQQRIRLMEFGTNIPFNILLEEIARDLVYYSNAFLVKSRVDKIQGGLKTKAVLGKKVVGGYFRMEPTEVEIKRDSSGTVSNYKLTGGSEEKEFAAADVVHFYADRDANNNFGTPRIISALEDVKILRKIEGNTLSLIYRFAIPLYQMKIGLPEPNFMATNQEISEAQDQVNKMPMDGIIVTNERTSFMAIGADGKAIDLSSYLSYYEKRVFTALNISEAMMGRGSAKQNADSMEGLMHDTVKYYQNIISIFIENFIFNELLLEGGYNPIFNISDIVRFEFNEINLDTKIKMENHALNKFQGNIITFEEARRDLGKKSDNVDESRLFGQMITTQSAIQVLHAKTEAANTSDDGNLKNGKDKQAKANGAAAATDSPMNQHGTTSAKVKESLSFRESEDLEKLNKTRNHEAQFRADYGSMYKLYNKMSNDIEKQGKFTKSSISKYTKELGKEMISILRLNAQMGYANSQLSGNKIEIGSVDIEVPEELTRTAKNQVENLIKDISKKIDKKERDIGTCFEFMQYRLRFACNYLSRKAYIYAAVKGYGEQGFKKIELNLSDDHYSEHESVISTDNFNIDQIPPFSPYCSCEIIKPKAIL